MPLTLLLAALLAAPARADLGDHVSGPTGWKVVESDWQSSHGLLVDRSCRTGLTQKEFQEAAQRLEAAMTASLARLELCGKAIPSIPYLGDAAAIMKRFLIVCTPSRTDPQFTSGKYGAYAVCRPSNAPHPRIHPEGDLPSSYSHQWGMVIPDNLANLSGPNVSEAWTQSTLFHEALHCTGANSREDHAAIELVKQDPRDPCKPNYLDDRVVFLEAACGYQVHKDPLFNVQAELRHRIQRCDVQRACVDTLTKVDENTRDGAAFLSLPARVIGTPKARLLRRDMEGRLGRDFNLRSAQLTCADIAAAMNQSGYDIDALVRVNRASRYVLQGGMGLGNGIPAYYLKTYSIADRATIEAMGDVSRRVAAGCGPFEEPFAGFTEELYSRNGVDTLSGYAELPGAKERVRLKSFAPLTAPIHCPLNAGTDEYKLVGEVAAFHNREAALQGAFIDALQALLGLLKGVPGSVDEVKLRIVAAAAEHCAGRFKPLLCGQGEQVMLDAAAEIGAKLRRR